MWFTMSTVPVTASAFFIFDHIMQCLAEFAHLKKFQPESQQDAASHDENDKGEPPYIAVDLTYDIIDHIY